MAVALEFIDFVVRVDTIRERYPGGWDQCLADQARILGYRVWYDEHLLGGHATIPRTWGLFLEHTRRRVGLLGLSAPRTGNRTVTRLVAAATRERFISPTHCDGSRGRIWFGNGGGPVKSD